MKILGIETSCDETSVAVVEDGNKILSNIISSQIELHKKFGGVVPEIASRQHFTILNFIVQTSLEQAKVNFKDIDAIAVTQGPGLTGCLLMGISAAKCYSFVFKKPLIGINHIEAHLCSIFLEHKLSFPFIGLVVSGGHTNLIYVENFDKYEIIGKSIDDAAGEAFDKVAKILNLEYPGGPIIDNLSKQGNSKAINFPKANVKKNKFDFSFSGLKTAVLNYTIKYQNKYSVFDIVASFQQAVIDVLIEKTLLAVSEKNVQNIVLTGGVASNSKLRLQMKEKAEKIGVKVFYPSLNLCTDNAAMVASLGYYKLKKNMISQLDIDILPDWKLF